MEEYIYQAVAAALNCKHLAVDSDGKHFDLVVISDDFQGKTLIARHRLIYRALEDKQEQIHALSMQLFTIAEWQAKQ